MTKTHVSALLALIAVLASGTVASAETALDAIYGTPAEGASARSLALGQTGVASLDGAATAVQNPALLATFGGQAHLNLQVGIRTVSEDRFVPLYDTFDDKVAETAYAFNRHTYGNAQGGLIWQIPGENQGALAIGLYDRFDADFDYEEEIRSASTDDLEQLNRVAIDGRLRAWTLGYGREAVSNLHIGLAIHRYFGDVESRVSEAPVDAPNTWEQFARDLSGWGFTAGIHAFAWERVDLGLSVEAPATLEGSHEALAFDGSDEVSVSGAPTDGDYEVKLPASLTMGFAYHPRNDLRTAFRFDARRRFWTDLEDDYQDSLAVLAGASDGADLGFRDTWDVRVGVEHVFYNGVPARFGLRWAENYADRDSERVVFSVGTGYVVEDIRVDLTGLFTRQTTRQDFLFDEGASGLPNPGGQLPKVEDSIVQLVVGVSRNF